MTTNDQAPRCPNPNCAFQGTLAHGKLLYRCDAEGCFVRLFTADGMVGALRGEKVYAFAAGPDTENLRRLRRALIVAATRAEVHDGSDLASIEAVQVLAFRMKDRVGFLDGRLAERRLTQLEELEAHVGGAELVTLREVLAAPDRPKTTNARRPYVSELKRGPSVDEALEVLRTAHGEGEHTGACVDACDCWLGVLARAGAFGERAQRHAETEARAIPDDELEGMVESALDVLADPVTLDELLNAMDDDAVANGRGMAPTIERVGATVGKLRDRGVIVETIDEARGALYALAG